MRRRVSRAVREEGGAILPLMAILLIMLLGFAALGVDASAAYASMTNGTASICSSFTAACVASSSSTSSLGATPTPTPDRCTSI